jgi:hypothetical protein
MSSIQNGPSRSTMLSLQSHLTTLYGATAAMKRSLSNVPMSQRFLLLGLFIILLSVIIYVFVKYKKIKQENKYFTEPVFICNISGKCPFDNSYGAHNAKKVYEFRRNPNSLGTKYVPAKYFDPASNTAFTLSFWFYLNVLPEGTATFNGNSQIAHILHKGEPLEEATDILETRQSPGFWFSAGTNTITVLVSTIGGGPIGEGIKLEDVPMNKWTNITAVINGQTMDLYIDGMLEITKTFFKKIRPTNGKLFITNNGGFPGQIAYVQYYNKPLTPTKVKESYEHYKKSITKYLDELEDQQLRIPMQNQWILDDEFSPDDGTGGTTDDGGSCNPQSNESEAEAEASSKLNLMKSSLMSTFDQAKSKLSSVDSTKSKISSYFSSDRKKLDSYFTNKKSVNGGGSGSLNKDKKKLESYF